MSGGWGDEEARQRLDAQRRWTERAAAADHIIHNDGSYEDFIAEVDETFREMKEQLSAGTLPKSQWFAWREANPKPVSTRGSETRFGQECRSVAMTNLRTRAKYA